MESAPAVPRYDPTRKLGLRWPRLRLSDAAGSSRGKGQCRHREVARPLPRSLKSSGGTKACESLLPGPAALDFWLEWGAGNQASQASEIRGRFPDFDAIGVALSTRLSRSPSCLYRSVSESFCLGLCFSLCPSPSPSVPFPQPPPAGDLEAAAIRAWAAAARRLRGRGGDCSQEAGLVVIFSYPAV